MSRSCRLLYGFSVRILLEKQRNRQKCRSASRISEFGCCRKSAIIETIRRYRRRFANFKPTSQWNGLQDHDFLKVIGALRKDEKGVLRPTLAGLVCFGDFVMIAAHVPNYFVDYREKLTGETRWNDRVCAQYIFNIFALVKIGERSGHGLSNLFGVWKKSGYPEPMISESYDPDRTTIELKFEVVPKAGQVLTQNDAAGSAESRQELDNNQTINRQEKLVGRKEEFLDIPRFLSGGFHQTIETIGRIAL